jgi:carbonic anhydrase
MKKQWTVLALAAAFSFSAPAVFASDHGHHKAHWSYSGAEGPSHWGSLDKAYSTCSTGKNQSPINLTRMIEAELPPLTLHYAKGGHKVLNNGHTIQVNYMPGSFLTVDDHNYELKQFHFHAPSENTIDGRHYPMEAHFVHADSKGNLAVVALMIEEGAENPALAKAWAQMPKHAGEKHELKRRINGLNLLPKNHDYYRFNGSLTTPPCTEGVKWFVMKQPVSASKAQIEAFKHVMHHDNNRPVQPVNARVLVK